MVPSYNGPLGTLRVTSGIGTVERERERECVCVCVCVKCVLNAALCRLTANSDRNRIS